MSLVLLTSEGVVARKLALVSAPPDYVVPDGMILSWKEELVSTHATVFWTPSGPPVSYFYFRTACGEIRRTSPRRESESFSIIVQGKNSADVNLLRDKILQMIHCRYTWDAQNDLNSFWSKLVRRFRS